MNLKTFRKRNERMKKSSLKIFMISRKSKMRRWDMIMIEVTMKKKIEMILNTKKAIEINELDLQVSI
jgi:hypothetical protein